MTFRRAARVDANQAPIVKEITTWNKWHPLDKILVLHLHQLKNCCDLAVGYKKKIFFIELKDGQKPKSKQKLTEGEQEFFEEWKGYPIFVATKFDELLRILQENTTIQR